MDHPLDDCRLKVARAKEQFESLRQEVIEFDSASPYSVELSVDQKTGEEVLRCANPPAFPRRWGVIVGEIAHNLRSTLDYLVGVLIRESGRESDGNTAFPISKTEARYLKKNKRGVTYRDRLLRGVPDPLKAKIDALQPFTRGHLAYADALLALRDLTNRDKHRDLHPAYTWINVPPGRAFAFPTDDEMRDLEIRMPREGGFSVQAQFKRGRGTPAAIVMYPKARTNRPSSVEVVFGRDPSKLTGLDDVAQLILHVGSIIELFAVDLPP